MSDALVYQALKKLPDWMVDVSERFDKVVNNAKKCSHKLSGKDNLKLYL